jgi:hypothetical protein
MKKWICYMPALIAALYVTAMPAGKNFGIGLALGDPTGFTAKYWTSGTTALDFSLGWKGNYWYGRGYYDDRCYDAGFRATHGWCYDERYGYDNGDRYGWRILHLHADYLFHNFNVIRTSERFPLFYGPGLTVNFVDQNFVQFGARGDFGIAWLPRRVPMDVFFEIGPGLILFPYPDFDLDASLGTRFYF